jgi:hypothetical protein
VTVAYRVELSDGGLCVIPRPSPRTPWPQGQPQAAAHAHRGRGFRLDADRGECLVFRLIECAAGDAEVITVSPVQNVHGLQGLAQHIRDLLPRPSQVPSQGDLEPQCPDYMRLAFMHSCRAPARSSGSLACGFGESGVFVTNWSRRPGCPAILPGERVSGLVRGAVSRVAGRSPGVRQVCDPSGPRYQDPEDQETRAA